VSSEDRKLVDWDAYALTRRELGPGFVRILGYFREDGIKSVAAVEEAMRANNPAAMVIPAHTLKGEARQFGAEPLGALAETIEMLARDAVEHHDGCEEALVHVVKLRGMFNETLGLLEQEATPVVSVRRPAGAAPRAMGGFGRRAI